MSIRSKLFVLLVLICANLIAFYISLDKLHWFDDENIKWQNGREFIKVGERYISIKPRNHTASKNSNTTFPKDLQKEYGANELKKLLEESVESWGEPWIFEPNKKYRSTPYQPTFPNKEPPSPIILKKGKEIVPKCVYEEIERVCGKLGSKRSNICTLFRNCFPNTLEQFTYLLSDNTTYIITGDIDLMWLRDSSAQYIHLHQYSDIQRIIEGLIKRQFWFIKRNPYASAFRYQLREQAFHFYLIFTVKDEIGPFHEAKGRNMYVAMHNYELDSLCYPISLSYKWWKASGRNFIFTKEWFQTSQIILNTWITEQSHAENSLYRYVELPEEARAHRVKWTGMTWSAFRPSDDQVNLGYHIPGNMFVAVSLEYLAEIYSKVYHNETLARVALKLRSQIMSGIYTHGVVEVPNYDRVFAYETDGYGNYVIMDDANIPSLLSIDYLGFRLEEDPKGVIANNTRMLVLSKRNKYYFEGEYAKGIGSVHTPEGYIWHLSLIMQGLTTSSRTEMESILETLSITDGGKNFMHESFNANNPNQYTREWFAWANSLFSELVLLYDRKYL